MIQRYLELLNEEQLTRVIESPMLPGNYIDDIGSCLVGTAEQITYSGNALARCCDVGTLMKVDNPNVAGNFRSVEMVYDDLCERYSVGFVNDGIRLKAITILAQRTAARTFEPEQEKALV